MKKILIGLLILIPILIIVSVGLVGNIVSVEGYISVEKVELNAESIMLEGVGQSFKLQANLFPKLATNKSVKYYLATAADGTADVTVLDSRFTPTEDRPACVVTSDGLVTANTYCVFTVICESQGGGKKAYCRFGVKGGKAEHIEIEAETALKVGDTVMASVTFDPVDSVINAGLEWSSDNEKIVSVDANGIVTAKSEGVAKISVVYGELSAEKTITVSKSAIKTGLIYTETGKVSMAAVSEQSPTSLENINVIDGEAILTSSDSGALVFQGGERVEIKKVPAGAFGFIGAEFLNGRAVLIGKEYVKLTLGYLDKSVDRTLPSGIPVTSSDESVAYLKDGFVVPVSAGKVTFTAEYNGFTATIELEIKTSLSYFVLSDSETKDAVGIKQETVYATRTFADKTKSAYSSEDEILFTRQFSVAQPETASADDIVWTTDDESVAWFDENVAGLLHYTAEPFEGVKTITVTARAKNPTYKKLTPERKYTFKLIDGYNTYSEADFAYVASVLHAKAAMFGDAIVSNENDKGWDYGYNVRNDVYGNGHMVANYTDNFGRLSDRIVIDKSGVTLSNLAVRSHKPLEVITEKEYIGIDVRIKEDAQIGETARITDVVIDGCVLENSFQSVVVNGADVTFRATIVRNVSKNGICTVATAETANYASYADIVVENCIFSNINCPAICLYTDSTKFEGKPPVDENGNAVRQHDSVRLKGFVDFYNWKDLNNLDIFGDLTGNSVLDGAIRDYFKELIKKGTYAEISYAADNGKQYANFAIFAAGYALVEPPLGVVYTQNPQDDIYLDSNEDAYKEILFEEQRLLYFLGDTLGGLQKVKLFAYSGEEERITPTSTYEENVELYERLNSVK